MENWLKCNKCYRPAIDSSKEFFVTQCEHVFCSACVVEARKQCPECQAVGSQTIILQTPMPQQMCHYFTSVSSLVDRAFDAARFQRNQFMIALRYARHIEEKYEKGKRFYEQASKEIQALSAMRRKLREDIEKLRVAGAPSAAAPESFARSSNVHRENQRELTLACVPMSLESQCRDLRIVPDMSDSHCSQQIRHHREKQVNRALEYNQPSAEHRSSARVLPQHRMIRESSNIPVPSISTQSRSSTNHQEQQIKRALEYSQPSTRPSSRVRVTTQNRMLTESSNIPVPSISTQSRSSTNQQEQQIKRALEYNQPSTRPCSRVRVTTQHRMLTESSNIPVPSSSTQSRSSTNQQEQQINRALEYNQPCTQSCSSASVAPQHRVITESSNIPVSSIFSQSRQYTHHRESQNRRAVENTPMSVYQNHSNRQMANYRYNHNSEDNLCQYPPRTIISSAWSSSDRTPQEEINRAAINRRIPKSIETSSNTSHSENSGGTFRNTPNSLGRFPNYNF